MARERRPVGAGPDSDGGDDRAGVGQRAPRSATRAESRAAAAPAGGAAAGASTEEPAGDRLVVEDGPVATGQMLASVFRERASVAIRGAVDARLGATAMFGAPAVDRILAALLTPGVELESVVRELAPAARDATSADGLLEGLLSGVHACLDDHGAEGPVRDGAAGTGNAADGIPDRRGGGAAKPARGGPAPAGSFDALPPALQRWLPEVEQVLAELDDLIGRATWDAMRPGIRAVTGVGSHVRAGQRRRGVMPDLEGIGSVTSVDEVVAGIRALQPGWPRMPVKDRMQEILDVVNRALIGADVPAAKDVEWSSHKSMAAFDFKAWILLVSPGLFDKSDDQPPATNDKALKARPADGKPLDDGDAAELAATAAHEARHGEQWFLAARFAAAQGMDGAAIVAAQGIDKGIADVAVTRKLEGLSPQRRELAATMHQATIVDRAENSRKLHETGYAEMAQRRADAVAARDALRGSPGADALSAARAALAALRAAMDSVIEKYVAYREIPFEKDSHEVDAAAELAFEATP